MDAHLIFWPVLLSLSLSSMAFEAAEWPSGWDDGSVDCM